MSRRRKHQPAPICPYCDKPSQLVPSTEVYGQGRDFGGIWLCRPCDAWVGCHKGSFRPKGRLADRALRDAKIRAHAAFDPLWKSGEMARGDAYGWLADHMGLERRDCHIGMFDVDQCSRVVMICDWWRDRRAA